MSKVNRTVKLNDCTGNVAIKGIVTFSRIKSQIAGDELRRDIERKTKNGSTPITDPYSTISLECAEVVCIDPAHPSNVEIFAAESMFTSSKHRGNCFQKENKGKFLPRVGIVREDKIEDIILDGELAGTVTNPDGSIVDGMHVTVICNVFESKTSVNKGFSVASVIINEAEPRYYQGSSNIESLGLTWATKPAQPIASQVQTQPQPVVNQVQPVTQAQPVAQAQFVNGQQPAFNPQQTNVATQPAPNAAVTPVANQTFVDPNALAQAQYLQEQAIKAEELRKAQELIAQNQAMVNAQTQMVQPAPFIAGTGFTGSENAGGIVIPGQDRQYN